MNTALLTQLQEVLDFARTNSHSDMYRTLYSGHSLTLSSLSDWQALPPLEKELVVQTPFWKRTFTPPSGVDYIRASSGTSGKNLFVVPKTRLMPTPSVMKPEMQTGILTFLQPQHQYEMDYWIYGHKIPVIAGDPVHLEECVRLAADVGVSSIQTYPFILEQKLPLLQRYGIDKTLQLLVLTGERVSLDDAKRYVNLFPKAMVILWYASIECQGVPAWAIVTKESTSLSYTPGPDYYWELLDDDDRAITQDGTEGEVVYTTLWGGGRRVLPLIRYKTGDLGYRTTHADGTVTYTILGRKHIDRIKILGGELRIEEVEAALTQTLGMPTEFQLHYQKRSLENQPPQILLRVKKIDRALDPAELAVAVAKCLKVAPEKSYDSLTSEGIHAPLICEVVNDFPYTAKKKKKFHVHEGSLPESGA